MYSSELSDAVIDPVGLPVVRFDMVGLRCLALTLLQRRLAPLWAGLTLGLIWGLWHLPAFFLSGTPQSGWGVAPFLVGSIAVSVILTSPFNRSGGSILLAALFRFQRNNPLWPDAQPQDTFFFVAAGAVMLWFQGGMMPGTCRGVTAVIRGAAEARRNRRAK